MEADVLLVPNITNKGSVIWQFFFISRGGRGAKHGISECSFFPISHSPTSEPPIPCSSHEMTVSHTAPGLALRCV